MFTFQEPRSTNQLWPQTLDFQTLAFLKNLFNSLDDLYILYHLKWQVFDYLLHEFNLIFQEVIALTSDLLSISNEVCVSIAINVFLISAGQLNFLLIIVLLA